MLTTIKTSSTEGESMFAKLMMCLEVLAEAKFPEDERQPPS